MVTTTALANVGRGGVHAPEPGVRARKALRAKTAPAASERITTGGTFAALRHYIVGHGGSVVATTSLAHKNGVHQKFAIAAQSLSVLRSHYGIELDDYWIGTFGHAPSHLTEAEAEFLAFHARTEWAGLPRGPSVLQRLRERINRAAATGG